MAEHEPWEANRQPRPNPLCDIWSVCGFFTGPTHWPTHPPPIHQLRGGGVAPSRQKEYTGRYFRVDVHVRLLRRESPTRGGGGWVPPRWGGGDAGVFKEWGNVGSLLG